MKKIDAPISYGGYCRRCRTTHVLPPGNARFKAIELIARLERQKSLALSVSADAGDPILSTASLFGQARGKMFGVLEGICEDGSITWIYAFSGQYNGHWQVPDWAPPLFDIELFKLLNDPVEQQIKRMGRQLEAEVAGSVQRTLLLQQRRELARRLMIDIHGLYRLHNSLGERRDLASVLITKAGIPTGTGDCCAPKLLNQAARENIAPLSLAEFYFGRENRSQSRRHAHFYPSCTDKCTPLLGFMLCGAAEKRDHYHGRLASHPS